MGKKSLEMNSLGNVEPKAEEVVGDSEFSGRTVMGTATNQEECPFIGGISYHLNVYCSSPWYCSGEYKYVTFLHFGYQRISVC